MWLHEIHTEFFKYQLPVSFEFEMDQQPMKLLDTDFVGYSKELSEIRKTTGEINLYIDYFIYMSDKNNFTRKKNISSN